MYKNFQDYFATVGVKINTISEKNSILDYEIDSRLPVAKIENLIRHYNELIVRVPSENIVNIWSIVDLFKKDLNNILGK